MPALGAKNTTSATAASADLGLSGGLGAGMVDPAEKDADEEKKKKLLQQQRELMGLSGASVYGAASMSLFGDAGNG